MIQALLPMLAMSAAVSVSPPVDLHVACRNVPGLESLMKAKGDHARFFIFGEKHGTNEYPALFADVVCNLAKTRSIQVSLEYSVESTEAVRDFVASDGSVAARARLLNNDAWDARYADGRSSTAMLKLLESIRQMKAAGLPITVFCSQPDVKTLQPQFYNELYRANLWALNAVEEPSTISLVLVGTAHAALFDNDDLGFLPAAAHLHPSDVVSVGPLLEGGYQWSLDVTPDGKPQMGPHALPGKASARGRGLVSGRREIIGFDALYSTGGSVTPSPPAGAPKAK